MRGKNLKFPQNPDDQWVYDPEVVPEGWLVKKYTFNSSHSKKVRNSYRLQHIINILLVQTAGPKNILISNLGGRGFSLPHSMQADTQRQATGL